VNKIRIKTQDLFSFSYSKVSFRHFFFAIDFSSNKPLNKFIVYTDTVIEVRVRNYGPKKIINRAVFLNPNGEFLKDFHEFLIQADAIDFAEVQL
jgi:hypothetical protein